jgi:hypothetical protein
MRRMIFFLTQPGSTQSQSRWNDKLEKVWQAVIR